MRLTVAAAAASALLLWAASPPLGLAWTAWIALAPAAAVALRWPGTRRARAVVPLAIGLYLELLLIPSFPFGLAADQWGEPPLPVLIAGSPLIAIALVAVPLAALALYAVRFPQPLPAAPLLVAPTAFVALDLVRTRLDPGAFWGPLFLSQTASAASGLAALGGPWLVSFAIAVSGYALAYAVVRRRPLALAAPAVVAAGILLAPAAPQAARTLTVAAVQPGYDTSAFERPLLQNFRARRFRAAADDLVADLAPLTREAARAGARLVVWPEATLWVDPATVPALRRLAAETRASLVVPVFLPGPDHGFTIAVSPKGTLSPAQPKQRPMWYLGERDGNRIAPRPVSVAGERLGTLLGVDNGHPEVARSLVAADATVLAASTHDWRELAVRQREFARLNARSLARPLVRADWRYGSAIVDRDGDVVADAGTARRRTVLVARVRTGGGETAYAAVGDLFGWAALAGFTLAWAVGIRRRASGGLRAPAPGAAR